MTINALPADEARCPGYEPEIGDLFEGCEDCRRYTDRNGEGDWWIEPPRIIAFECEMRIAP